jgi:hypothetical protein
VVPDGRGKLVLRDEDAGVLKEVKKKLKALVSERSFLAGAAQTPSIKIEFAVSEKVGDSGGRSVHRDASFLLFVLRAYQNAQELPPASPS